MTSWQDFEIQAPELATVAREVMGRHKHKVLATLRKDGSPRVSGTEARLDGGELWMGSMPGAVKALDLRRDPRMALHDPARPRWRRNRGRWAGDVKLAGRAVAITDPKVLAEAGLPGTDSHCSKIGACPSTVWTG